MEFILEDASGINGLASMACACWVASLNNEPWDEAMEDGVIVIPIKTMLEKGAGGDWGLFGEKF